MGGYVQHTDAARMSHASAMRADPAPSATSSSYASPPNGSAGMQPLLQLRRALNATPRMQHQHALQRMLHRGSERVNETGRAAQPVSSAPSIIQRKPRKDADTGLWHDDLFPSLKLTQPEGFDEKQFLLGDGKVVWWEDNEYYLDQDCETLYQPTAELSSDRTHYIPLAAEGTLILSVSDVLSGFDTHSKALMNDPDPLKLDGVIKEINAGKAIYPIQIIRRPDGKYSLNQGRHRLLASREMGFEEIPALVEDVGTPPTLGFAKTVTLSKDRSASSRDTNRNTVVSESSSMESTLEPAIETGFGTHFGSSAVHLEMQIPPAKDAESDRLSGYHIIENGYQVHNERWIESTFNSVKSTPTRLYELAQMMMVEFDDVDRRMKKIYLSYLIDINHRVATQPMFESESDELETFLHENA
ncbi:ParB/RepB/Spo0J family partition protein [Tardiphaga sp. vice278]|uniref:ParB/RepB/Spo0J family partition protein n=1 Tax=Tardiphaga sp. vice278 TaxID=2592815 RepID=UPI00143DB753|nr:ParB/RepB/Spo0J family partition protein [Tardiphaga sp. vice278]